MTIELSQHPCFNEDVKGKYGRIHLPVAPKCNIQCNFCNRKYDCVNESRPGVASQVLSPQQALAYFRDMKQQDPRLTVVGIAGPGDPFANPTETMQTLRLIRAEFPDILLCVATNGLNAAPYIAELAELQVRHLTVTINAIDPKIGKKVYPWVRDGKKTYRGFEGAELLLERQLEVVRLCKLYGLTVKINTILIPGVNDEHVLEVARSMSEMGADLFNCIGMCRAEGAAFDNIPEPDPSVVCQIRSQATRYLPQMKHCMRCRADAVGCLSDALPMTAIKLMRKYASGPLDPQEKRPYVAAATREGLLVNVHLGKALQLHIYRHKDHGANELIETRPLPEPGEGDQRWEKLADLLHDCRALFVADAGPKPSGILLERGVKVIPTDSLIDQAIADFYQGKSAAPPAQPFACGRSCGGNAKGCA